MELTLEWLQTPWSYSSSSVSVCIEFQFHDEHELKNEKTFQLHYQDFISQVLKRGFSFAGRIAAKFFVSCLSENRTQLIIQLRSHFSMAFPLTHSIYLLAVCLLFHLQKAFFLHFLLDFAVRPHSNCLCLSIFLLLSVVSSSSRVEIKGGIYLLSSYPGNSFRKFKLKQTVDYSKLRSYLETIFFLFYLETANNNITTVKKGNGKIDRFQ